MVYFWFLFFTCNYYQPPIKPLIRFLWYFHIPAPLFEQGLYPSNLPTVYRHWHPPHFSPSPSPQDMICPIQYPPRTVLNQSTGYRGTYARFLEPQSRHYGCKFVPMASPPFCPIGFLLIFWDCCGGVYMYAYTYYAVIGRSQEGISGTVWLESPMQTREGTLEKTLNITMMNLAITLMTRGGAIFHDVISNVRNELNYYMNSTLPTPMPYSRISPLHKIWSLRIRPRQWIILTRTLTIRSQEEDRRLSI